tara:strand:+ start:50101 stop:51462 length:1362 start_codon:yes stop_codon:yes gene_type:complete
MNKYFKSLNYFSLNIKKLTKQEVYQEVSAGFTTFITIAYIVVVNPIILQKSGMPFDSIFIATCLTAAIGCLLLGLMSNFPAALAPGMGLNVYFAYQITQNYNYSWQDALGLVFIASIILIIITSLKIRDHLIKAIPHSLSMAISVGVGLFIALIALKEINMISYDPHSFLKLNSLKTQNILIASIGFFTIIILENYKVKASILISIAIATIANLAINISYSGHEVINEFNQVLELPNFSIADTFFSMKFSFINSNILHTPTLNIIFTIVLIVLFDSLGVYIAILKQYRKLNPEYNKNIEKNIPNALLANNYATLFGSIFGTSPTVPFLESIAGIKSHGKTGLTAITVAICFILVIILAPIVKLIPMAASAPVILYISCLMIENVTEINWHDITNSIPSALIIIFIPFSFSIADGIGIGFICYTIINLFTGNIKKIHPLMGILSLIFLIFFVIR